MDEIERKRDDQETTDWQQFGTLIWGDDSMMIPSIDPDPQQNPNKNHEFVKVIELGQHSRFL